MDSEGRWEGIFPDGDLHRLLEHEDYGVLLKEPISNHMGRTPKTLTQDQLVEEAHRLLRELKIDQAPVLDEDGRAVGLVDVQDLLDVGI